MVNSTDVITDFLYKVIKPKSLNLSFPGFNYDISSTSPVARTATTQAHDHYLVLLYRRRMEPKAG